MECVLQWLDNLDDLVSALALKAESIRRFLLGLLALGLAAGTAAAAALAVLAVPASAPLLAVLFLSMLAWEKLALRRAARAAT